MKYVNVFALQNKFTLSGFTYILEINTCMNHSYMFPYLYLPPTTSK